MLLARRLARTQLRAAALNKPFHLVLIETFHLSSSHVSLSIFLTGVDKGKLQHIPTNRHVLLRSIQRFIPFIP